MTNAFIYTCQGAIKNWGYRLRWGRKGSRESGVFLEETRTCTWKDPSIQETKTSVGLKYRLRVMQQKEKWLDR